MRTSDRPGTYASVDTAARTSAARAPLESDRSVPIPRSSANRKGTGRAGTAIAAASAAEARSQPTTSRRGRTRSTTLESRPPPSRNGRKPSAKVSDASSGEPVRR
jgi:hypothetical protein